jgi:hypothetical protein
MHEIVTGVRTAQEARAYYAKEFADYRRKLPTPYMEKLRFTPEHGNTGDSDQRLLSDDDLKRAEAQGSGTANLREGLLWPAAAIFGTLVPSIRKSSPSGNALVDHPAKGMAVLYRPPQG